MRTGREFKETTYPDDSLEFPTFSHVPYNLNINQGCDILEQDIPDVVISEVYTKYIHKTRKYILGIEYIYKFLSLKIYSAYLILNKMQTVYI